MVLPTRIVRLQQVDPVEAMHREFDGLLNRVLGARNAETAPQWAPYGVDISEDAEHLYVEAELPGFKKDEIEITLENHTLTIAAQRKPNAPEKKGELLLHERRYNAVQRSFNLPPTVDDQKVDAKLADGILTITLNKREENKPRKISVN